MCVCVCVCLNTSRNDENQFRCQNRCYFALLYTCVRACSFACASILICAVRERLNLDDIIFACCVGCVQMNRFGNRTIYIAYAHTHMEANRFHSMYGENKFNDLL